MWRIKYLALSLALCLPALVFAQDTQSQTAEEEPLPIDYEITLPTWSPSGIMLSPQPQTIEESLTGLEILLDSWQMDSQTLYKKLVELQTTVVELNYTLTQSERLAEGLAYSLNLERQKTQSLRRWLIVSSVAGGVLLATSVTLLVTR